MLIYRASRGCKLNLESESQGQWTKPLPQPAVDVHTNNIVSPLLHQYHISTALQIGRLLLNLITNHTGHYNSYWKQISALDRAVQRRHLVI